MQYIKDFKTRLDFGQREFRFEIYARYTNYSELIDRIQNLICVFGENFLKNGVKNVVL